MRQNQINLLQASLNNNKVMNIQTSYEYIILNAFLLI